MTWELWKLTRSPDQQFRALLSVVLLFLTLLILITISSIVFLDTDVDHKSTIKVLGPWELVSFRCFQGGNETKLIVAFL